ncbi:MFS transporter [Helicobacter sp. 11S02596-1]|uniref:MFS transporter n=1 Tax=Helicobacter sp. 11S02596-1 TaxID=1476194 RepID=UPI000BA5E238|nr:MFS transporter [Helicobacter sp. 11S02596-1]PAF41915.1 hypothetical protein BJI48_07610 [Helicobacter sp. 11S02596-1]
MQKIKNVDSVLFKFVIFGAAGTMALGNVGVSPVIPEIEKFFSDVPHIDFLSKFILTLPALFTLLFAPLVGYLMDKYNRLGFVLLGMFIWALSGMAGIWLENIYWMLFSRAILGVGTAALVVGIPVLIGDYYSGDKKDKALGLMGFAQVFGGAVLIAISGFLGQLGWHYAFWVYAIEIIALLAAFFILFEPERKAEQAGDNKEAFSLLKFTFLYLIGFILYLTFMSMPIQMPYLLKIVLGKDPQTIGLIIATVIFVAAFSPLFYAKIKQKISVPVIFFLCFVVMAVGFVMAGTLENTAGVIIGGMLAGGSFSVAIINATSHLFTLAPLTQRAKAYGVFGMLLAFGQFISPLFSQSLVNAFGLQAMFVICAGVLLFLGLVSLFLKKGVAT